MWRVPSLTKLEVRKFLKINQLWKGVGGTGRRRTNQTLSWFEFQCRMTKSPFYSPCTIMHDCVPALMRDSWGSSRTAISFSSEEYTSRSSMSPWKFHMFFKSIYDEKPVLWICIRIHVFGPPGSESGSESFYHHAKIVRKTLIPTVSWLHEKWCQCTFKK